MLDAPGRAATPPGGTDMASQGVDRQSAAARGPSAATNATTNAARWAVPAERRTARSPGPGTAQRRRLTGASCGYVAPMWSARPGNAARSAEILGGPSCRRYPWRHRSALRGHRAAFVGNGPDALVSAGQTGVSLRPSSFSKMAGWPHAVESIGAAGLHVHDLRHTGNQFAANSGAALKDLMTRIGHDGERAALIYQHKARGADQRITNGDRLSRPGRRRPGRR